MSWHLVTDAQLPFHMQIRILKQCVPHITTIHVRDKQASLQRLKQQIDHMLRLGLRTDQMILNTHAEAAAAWGLKGVHLPANSGYRIQELKAKHPDLMIGVSVHSKDEALTQAEEGADYLYFGHVFETNSKSGITPRGLAQLEDITQHMSVPVYAIGGITPENLRDVQKAGASGVAIMSGVWSSENPRVASQTYEQYGKDRATHEASNV
ncbi:thiamine phosphate synthase [Geomicrobium sp. JSM 1781026]|uniref:thiamine phosphate synthase n=1 Tax=Geomicrobium sp. JSM 1781026 TaxID=3344580 RepID=UPI0035C18B4F